MFLVFPIDPPCLSITLPLTMPRSYVSVAFLDGHIYAMGGFEGPPRNPSGVINSPRLRSAERFNPSTNQWTLIANMRERRSDASATSLNGNVRYTAVTSLFLSPPTIFSHLFCIDYIRICRWKIRERPLMLGIF